MRRVICWLEIWLRPFNRWSRHEPESRGKVGTSPADQVLPKVDFARYRAAMPLLPILFFICSDRDFAIRSDSGNWFGWLAFGSL